MDVLLCVLLNMDTIVQEITQALVLIIVEMVLLLQMSNAMILMEQIPMDVLLVSSI